MLSEKGLDQKGEMLKIKTQKFELNTVGSLEGGDLMSCDHSRAQ